MNIKLVVACFMLMVLLVSASPLVHAGPNLTIQAAEYGPAWPFTVNTITLSCRNVAAVVLTTPYGRTYALNGKALSQFKDLPDSRLIQKPGKFPGTVMALPNDIIARGLALCPR